MLIVGLSGTIASGKNFVTHQFESLGAKVFDADKEVRKILDQNKEVRNRISKIFPDAVIDNKIDRDKLGALVFGDASKLQILEGVIHPIVQKERERFIRKARFQNVKLVILNIPLLFEKGIYLDCDANILVTTPKLMQKQRFLEREKGGKRNFDVKLAVAKFEDILQNQMPNHHKMKCADFVINNGQSRAHTFKQVKEIFNQLN